MAHPERLERRTRAMARLGGLIPPSRCSSASLAGEQEFARRLNGVLDDARRAAHARHRHAAAAHRQLQGRGALWTLNTVAGWVPYNGVWNVTGQPAASVPAGFGSDGLPRGGAARWARQRRDHAAVAGRADRGRAPLGAAAPARVLVSEADCAARGGGRGRPDGGRAAAERVRRGVEREVVEQEHADRPRQRGRPRRRARDPRAARGAAPRRRLPRRGGRASGRLERAPLGGRSARRHRQLPVRDPAVVRERGGARR